ncbi:MAG: malate dehydrogenase [Methanobrevibacter sp.]|jgi:malate dehydrogenase|nr:malate dehydrogenase [Candidatus Methanovirga aequatorialis]
MKVSIIGASGRVGKTTAFCISEDSSVDDLVLISRKSSNDKVEGEITDMCDALAARDIGIKHTSSSNIEDISDSKIVIITAGIPRKKQKPMSRIDLVAPNAKIVAKYSKDIAKYSQNATILVITNPVDIMTYIALKSSGFDKSRVLGLGNHLDSLRLKNRIADHFDVHISEVHTRVIGEHGDYMVPLLSSTTIGGMPIEYLSKYTSFNIDETIEQVKNAGNYVIGKKGATEYGPAYAISNVASAILKDEKKILTVSTFLEGEIEGVNDVCLGVPVKLGVKGAERIIPIKMNKQEKSLFLEAANTVKACTRNVMKKLDL